MAGYGIWSLWNALLHVSSWGGTGRTGSRKRKRQNETRENTLWKSIHFKWREGQVINKRKNKTKKARWKWDRRAQRDQDDRWQQKRQTDRQTASWLKDESQSKGRERKIFWFSIKKASSIHYHLCKTDYSSMCENSKEKYMHFYYIMYKCGLHSINKMLALKLSFKDLINAQNHTTKTQSSLHTGVSLIKRKQGCLEALWSIYNSLYIYLSL